MVTKLHLHANFPYLTEIPNAALGYLKSALSEAPVNTTNVYWYLPPGDILESISSIYAKFQDRYIDIFEPPTVFTAYLSRYFSDEEKKNTHMTLIESLVNTYTTKEKIKKIAQNLRDFIDYSIEAENMADADIAGFTCNFYQWILNKYVWSTLKRLNPNIKIVAGGFATRSDAEAFMHVFKDIDYCIWGEGEVPLKTLVNRFDDNSVADIPRLVYRENKTLYSTDIPGECRLKPLPFADHTEYFERIEKSGLHISPAIPIVGVRSCRWNKCKFCGVNKGVPYSERPVKDTIGEIEYQSEKYTVNKFAFLDTDFGRKKDSDFEMLLTGLLKSVDERKKPYHIWATLSPILLTRKYTQMMSKIKMHIQIGFEALTDPLLKAMNKMHGFAENIQGLKFGKDYGLDISGNNIIRNLPEEREEDVTESMENLKYLRFVLPCYRLTPSELSLYKETEYYEGTLVQDREKKWVVNILYDEIEGLTPIEKEYKWDFFGFRARKLDHHQVWDQFAYLLKEYQEADISYTWLEFSDKSSLIEESNSFNGDKTYLLNRVETDVLKFCDSITSAEKLKNAFDYHEDVLKDAVTQLERVNLLYGDKRGRLISVVSVKDLKKIDKIG